MSVVIPIYNSEKFLHECLDSLHNQTIDSAEFICVNDGSTDSSVEIINEYISKDSRFSLLNKDNSGYGISMNMGFELARGEYIGIVESDDFVEYDMFESLYSIAHDLKLDMIKSNYFRFTTNSDGSHDEKYIQNTTNTNKVICPADYPKIMMNTTANWTGLYSKEFITKHNIKHNETPGASYQDLGFHFMTLSLAKRAYFQDKAYYHYRFDNPNSSINNINKMYCACDEYAMMREFYAKNPELGSIFSGVLWARTHNTCLNTYARVSPKLKKEFLKYYCDLFNGALNDGYLQKKYFDNSRWREMLSILRDPDGFHKRYMMNRKRDRVKKKYKSGVPAIYLLMWDIHDHGLKHAIKRSKEEIKKKLKINHWDVLDALSMHVCISGRYFLRKMHIQNLNKKMRRIQKLKDAYDGERCFIVCTGPSLKMNDLDIIRNEYSFGMNSIHLAYNKTDWRPSFYVCIDSYAQERMSNEYTIDYSQIAKEYVMLNKMIPSSDEDYIYKILTNYGNHKKNSKGVIVEGDISICAYDCFSVTNFALTCAIFMGFKEIYLIGCDCNYDGKTIHFVKSKLDPKEEEKNRWSNAVELSIEGYSAMKEYADQMDVKIYNATRGGYLEIFDRVDFDSIDFK